MKRFISLMLAVVLTLSMAAMASGCGKKEEKGSGVVTWYTTMDMGPDNERIFGLINERVKELTGCTIKFVSYDDSQYDLLFSAGEKFDLIAAPDHKGYWKNAAKGAFMEITEEDLAKGLAVIKAKF